MKRGLILILFGLLLNIILFAQSEFPDNGPLFIDTTVPRIDIAINPDTLNWIYENPESDLEFHARFIFNNGVVCDTINPVGFRLRGNTSRYSAKKSFKVSFNTFTEGGKYYGVEKLNLNGEHNDPSVMRSKLMWDILRVMGIAAPRANHVRVYINDNYYGLYINVEHIDEEFVLSRFGNNDGNLYKCLYPADLDYRGTDPDNYKFISGDRRVYELKTNVAEDDYSDLAELVNILTNSQDNSIACDLDRVFNTYDYMKIIATDIFCGNWDGYIFNKNNYYLYRNSATGKFEYIPYDVDNTFGIDWFGIDWANIDFYQWQPGGSEKRPLYNRIVNNQELRDQLTFYAREFVTGKIDIDSLVSTIEVRKDMIAPYIVDDPYYPLDYGYSYDDFLSSYSSATGAHVKYGLYPYLSARAISMNNQLENVTAFPVIKYIRHRRVPVDNVEIRATVDSDQSPLDVSLLYSVNDGDIQQQSMLADGNGSYIASLDLITDFMKVNYQVRVSDAAGNIKVLPCDPAVISAIPVNMPGLFINELMADNESTIADEYGNYSDWVEVYNGDSEDIFLGDYYLTDDYNSPTKWRMPDITLSKGGFELFWADGDPSLGDHHADFKLSKDGEVVGLFNADGWVIDSVSFLTQSADVSFGSLTDGGSEKVFFSIPTPGASNTFTGIHDALKDGALVVYPNPASGSVVRFNRRINCKIYNSSGILVITAYDLEYLDIGNFVPGIYIIVADNGMRTRLVIY